MKMIAPHMNMSLPLLPFIEVTQLHLRCSEQACLVLFDSTFMLEEDHCQLALLYPDHLCF